ncbi:hypothetical protein [Candidatus Finniella inopinata]|uniref:PhoD-like phosphatase domain-containing protein n=1 Tax=Candidatus Finniella inopinata TaxID=1696036 RepID=A0A4Q7DK53_9PROT|nr:hypothetical protein [Candidatus Finniella inopinata]RZI46434.1 hypothetical protein EQU50_02255 [Candidatus Finniella inopinata]
MMADTQTRMAPLSDDKAQQVENDLTTALLQYYSAHYCKPGFKEFLATVPSKSLSSDHEYFNGKGSYVDLPPVMAKIEQVAERFYMLFQHHTTKTRPSDTGLIGVIKGASLLSYNYLLQFETMAFYGLDTRTERTVNQISSPESLNFMFNKLNAVNQTNLFFVTEIPVVYQNLNPFTKMLQFFNKHTCLKSLYQKIEKDPIEQSNTDLSTDGVDEWSYTTHVAERNHIIQKFVANFVKSKGKKVIFLGGDVHSAGAGEVIDSSTGETQIFQLTSSALTSSPVPGFIVGLKRVISWFQKQEQFGAGLVDKITGYKKVSDGKESREIALNNWLELESVAGQIYPSLWCLPSENASLERWLPKGWVSLLDDMPLVVRS